MENPFHTNYEIEDLEGLEQLEDYDRDENAEVRCKYCRERDLFWKDTAEGIGKPRWVLIDREGKPHNCSELKKQQMQKELDF